MPALCQQGTLLHACPQPATADMRPPRCPGGETPAWGPSPALRLGHTGPVHVKRFAEGASQAEGGGGSTRGMATTTSGCSLALASCTPEGEGSSGRRHPVVPAPAGQVTADAGWDVRSQPAGGCRSFRAGDLLEAGTMQQLGRALSVCAVTRGSAEASAHILTPSGCATSPATVPLPENHGNCYSPPPTAGYPDW